MKPMGLFELLLRLGTASSPEVPGLKGQSFDDRSPYWKRSGWQAQEESLFGRYLFGKAPWWKGEIRRPFSSMPDYFIKLGKREAESVMDSEHGACFRPRGDGWFWVHISPAPRDVSLGILEVQRTMKEVSES